MANGIDAYTGFGFRVREEGETEEEYQKAWEEYYKSHYAQRPLTPTPGLQMPLKDLLAYLRGLPTHNPKYLFSVLEDLVRTGRIAPLTAVEAESHLPALETLDVERKPKRPYRPPVREPKVPPLTPASQMYYPFIEGLDTPAMQSYFKYQFPAIFAEFGGEKAMTAAEEARLKAAKTLEAYGNIKGRAEAGLKEAETTAASFVGMYRPTEVSKGVYEAREALGKAGAKTQSASDRYREMMAQHPFEAFLKKYPFMEKYMKMAPRERGEFPRIRRPTRWLGV